MVHEHTKNPEEITRQADIIISAVGIANLVKGSWLKPGAVVIDVGINLVDVRYSFPEMCFYSVIFFPLNQWEQLLTFSRFF